jgi:hypothetical protein
MDELKKDAAAWDKIFSMTDSSENVESVTEQI